MITRVEDGLIKVTGTAACFCGLWTRCRARQIATCKLSGKIIAPGDEQYRPITNTAQRGQRVKASEMDRYADPRLFAKYSRAK